MIKTESYLPSELSNEEWLGLYRLSQSTLQNTGLYSDQAIENLMGDFKDFCAFHLDPNINVGRSLNANQCYAEPRLVVSTYNNEIVGYGHAALNASGGGTSEGPHNDSKIARIERGLKLASIIKNYYWINEINTQKSPLSGIVALRIAKMLVGGAISFQPVTCYDRHEITPNLAAQLKELGFERTTPLGKEDKKSILGDPSQKITVVRYEAPTAKEVLKRLSGLTHLTATNF